MANKLSRAQIRRIENALSFVMERTLAIYNELDWALESKPIPRGQKIPPQWVRRAIVRTTETTFAPIYSRQPNKPENRTLANLLQLQGILLMEVSTLGKLSEDLEKVIDGASPKLCKKMARWENLLARKLAARLRRLPKPRCHRVSRNVTTIPRPDQIRSNIDNLNTGTKAFLDEKGEFVEGQTATAKLYLLSWFFWPLLKPLSSARQFREGVHQVGEEIFGAKLVERIYSELRIAEGNRIALAK